jgi:glutaconate CoA-transferase, subunit A
MGTHIPTPLGPDKRLSLDEAAALIRDGETLALGGMTLYRRPAAFARALARRPVRTLTLISFTAGYECDLLVGAGCVGAVRSCYFGLEAFGLAPMFTSRDADITVVEETEATLACGLRATIGRLSFYPTQALFGTDILNVRPDITSVACPYTGRQLLAVPPLLVDTAVLHVPLADSTGNAVLGGEHAVDRELALAAHQVILTAERIVPTEIVAAAGVDILGLRVAAVVHCPTGAHPTSCWPAYPLDGDHLLRYLDACAAGHFDRYLEHCGPDEAVYQARYVPAEWVEQREQRLMAWQEALMGLIRAVAPSAPLAASGGTS